MRPANVNKKEVLPCLLRFPTQCSKSTKLFCFLYKTTCAIQRRIFPIASACVVSGLLGDFIKGYLKKAVMRPRPFLEIPTLEPLIKRPKGFSFPSGHTTLAFAVAFIISRILPKRYSIPAFLMAALVAFSRLYLGVHYPTDILGGICIGYVAGMITDFLYKR